jgi:light-regulated signal transduction histidine kinase (bacteriophytochrome)
MSHVTADRLDSSKADQCAREPIHIPGAIQPHGALLALDPDGLRILQAAGATAAMLGAAPEQLVGQDIANWVHPHAVDRLRAFAAGDARLGKPLPLFEMNAWADGTPIRPAGIEAAGIEAVGHSSAGVLVIEFEARPADPWPDKLPLVRTMMLRMQEAARGTEAFCQAIADEVRDVSLFDRVMVYRFLPDDAGCVVAEARDPAVESFRGLRFPAADIPAQARRLYLHNWVRTIPDRNYAPAALHPAINTLTGAPLDLSQSILRSVSPVHLEYLANLGVQASMSLSLVVDGRLWGLIACHHDTPRYPSYALRTALESFAQMVSYQLASRLAAESYEERLRSEAKCVALLARMVGERDLASVIARLAPDLAAYVAADGLVIWTGGVAVMLGRTPDHAQHEALVAWLAEAAPEGVFFTHRLQADFPPSAAYAGSASGIAAVALAPRFRDGMMWLRREVVETVNWAGAQETALEDDRLRPRKSFAVWRESVFGQSSRQRSARCARRCRTS